MTDNSLADKANLLNDMFAPEPLHPDLVPYLNTESVVGAILHHPLVVQVMYREPLNKIINANYARKKTDVQTAIDAEDWRTYVFLHERPYRFNALMEAMEAMDFASWWELHDEPDLWSLIGAVWTDSENIHQHLEQWGEVWQINCDPSSRAHAMDEDEQAALAALPDTFTVWRGATHDGVADGLSWTPDKEKAMWFARRYAHPTDRPPYLAEGTVDKSEVLAYFSRETEVVLLPETIRDIKVTKLQFPLTLNLIG
jgi:hypothetical protein